MHGSCPPEMLNANPVCHAAGRMPQLLEGSPLPFRGSLLTHTGCQPSTQVLCRKGRRKAAAGSDSDYSEDEAISSASEDDASNDEVMSEGNQSEGGPLMVGMRSLGWCGCFVLGKQADKCLHSAIRYTSSTSEDAASNGEAMSECHWSQCSGSISDLGQTAALWADRGLQGCGVSGLTVRGRPAHRWGSIQLR